MFKQSCASHNILLSVHLTPALQFLSSGSINIHIDDRLLNHNIITLFSVHLVFTQLKHHNVFFLSVYLMFTQNLELQCNFVITVY